ncbi:MaoC family dehydratase [Variovorax sp. J22P271]|uniref:MaoC family dehydratase n=1 Tax=Variovorax davisae TaxID=3053515 RepID=UPI002576A092|nr:MaoC family dehydratase [Variovorax sp. J22P271]MDM0033757.1 MaoC family dehydratase [Variovorax sp. J22P271]
MNIPKDYTLAALKAHVGHDFGHSAPTLLDQRRIDSFAGCTGDSQWIHVDVDRARTQGPFGHTIAHGLLLLSLIPAAHFELNVYPADASGVLNYGFDRVRFLAPVPSGSYVRLQVELAEVSEKQPGQWLVRCRNTAHARGEAWGPVMVAESLALVMA